MTSTHEHLEHAEHAQHAQHAAHDPFAHALGKEDEANKTQAIWAGYIKRYIEDELPKLKTAAEKLDKEAKEYDHLSHLSHDRTSRFDLGELGVELGIVFCSPAVLTKRTSWWNASMVVGLIGLLVALSAFLKMAHQAAGE